jgi:hypothetical protein
LPQNGSEGRPRPPKGRGRGVRRGDGTGCGGKGGGHAVPVHDYARERLAEAAEDEPTRRAHLQCFVDLVEQAERRIEQREQGLRGGQSSGNLSRGGGWGPRSLERTLDRLDAETPNLRAALEFARESGDTVAALRLTGPLGRYAYLRGQHEVRQWMDAAVTADPDAPADPRSCAVLPAHDLAPSCQPTILRRPASPRSCADPVPSAGSVGGRAHPAGTQSGRQTWF